MSLADMGYGALLMLSWVAGWVVLSEFVSWLAGRLATK